jgi:hypothetical protein
VARGRTRTLTLPAGPSSASSPTMVRATAGWAGLEPSALPGTAPRSRSQARGERDWRLRAPSGVHPLLPPSREAAHLRVDPARFARSPGPAHQACSLERSPARSGRSWGRALCRPRPSAPPLEHSLSRSGRSWGNARSPGPAPGPRSPGPKSRAEWAGLGNSHALPAPPPGGAPSLAEWAELGKRARFALGPPTSPAPWGGVPHGVGGAVLPSSQFRLGERIFAVLGRGLGLSTVACGCSPRLQSFFLEEW